MPTKVKSERNFVITNAKRIAAFPANFKLVKASQSPTLNKICSTSQDQNVYVMEDATKEK